MKTYDVLMQDGETYGMQLVRIDVLNIRPLDATFDGELMRARSIELPCEIKYCKWDNGLVAMTGDERALRDAYDAELEVAAEAEAQAAKTAKLKAAENKFFDLCFAVFGDRTKRGFDELNTAIEAMTATDPSTATALAIRLLAVDAECKREGGNSWWDTAAYHEEVAE